MMFTLWQHPLSNAFLAFIFLFLNTRHTLIFILHDKYCALAAQYGIWGFCPLYLFLFLSAPGRHITKWLGNIDFINHGWFTAILAPFLLHICLMKSWKLFYSFDQFSMRYCWLRNHPTSIAEWSDTPGHLCFLPVSLATLLQVNTPSFSGNQDFFIAVFQSLHSLPSSKNQSWLSCVDSSISRFCLSLGFSLHVDGDICSITFWEKVYRGWTC